MCIINKLTYLLKLSLPILAALLFTPVIIQASVIFVDIDATGTPNGGSWEDAYTDLQSALSIATLGDEIWVSEGIYKPLETHGGTGDRFKSFQMKNGVAIYGGFAGWEILRNQRDWGNNQTIISGDIGMSGDDSDNCYHVFYHPVDMNLDSSAKLDGLIITKGNANVSLNPGHSGGGMYNGDNSSPTLINCVFRDNFAKQGGGMYNLNGSSPTLTNCIFENNTGIGGGGVFNISSSSPIIDSCTFKSNSTSGHGGGMRNGTSSSPILTNCTFLNNSADSVGGGMHNWSLSSPTLTNCTFEVNVGNLGGGIGNFGESSPTLTNCSFIENSANLLGGGLFNDYSSLPTLIECIFSGNSAADGGGGICNYRSSSSIIINTKFEINTAGSGGGIYNWFSSPVITNCIISKNTAITSDGGGMINYESFPIITNCTIFGNSAYISGGGIQNVDSSPTLTNCILWENSAPEGNEIHNNNDSSPVVTFSDIQGSYTGISNIAADPIFIDADSNDFHLSEISPCKETGDNKATEIQPTDMDGNARIMDGIVDMGAYEVPGEILPIIDSFTASPEIGEATLDVFFTCIAHDFEGSIISYILDFDDGNIEANNTGVFTHQYDTPEIYNTTCTVVDNDDLNSVPGPLVIIVEEPDYDDDNVPDIIDNCRYYNPKQFDSDGDGVGDVCDYCLNDPNKIYPGLCGCGEAEDCNDSGGGGGGGGVCFANTLRY